MDNPGEAAVYEDLEETPQLFILSLRGAFRRAGRHAVVRKLRGRDEVRAWLQEPEAEDQPKKTERETPPTGRKRGSTT